MPVTSPVLEAAPCDRADLVHVEPYPVQLPELSAADCKTTKDWERWARDRREYEEPYAPIGGRY